MEGQEKAPLWAKSIALQIKTNLAKDLSVQKARKKTPTLQFCLRYIFTFQQLTEPTIPFFFFIGGGGGDQHPGLCAIQNPWGSIKWQVV